MFFIDSLELDRLIRLVRERHSDEAVSEDLRGWSWEGRLSPYENFYFGVGELANRYCPTYRDIYLRRVLKIQAPYTFKTVRGWVYHAVSADALTRVKAVLYSKGITPGYKIVDYLKPRVKEYVDKILKEYNVDKYLKNEEVKLLRRNSKTLYNYLILQAAASVDRVIASSKYLTLDSLVHQAIPDVVEMRIDDDQDCIWLRVDVAGGASCHVGYRSCFYRKVPVGVQRENSSELEFLEAEKTFDPKEVYGDAPNPTQL